MARYQPPVLAQEMPSGDLQTTARPLRLTASLRAISSPASRSFDAELRRTDRMNDFIDGAATPTSTAATAMTTTSSTRVNPRRRRCDGGRAGCARCVDGSERGPNLLRRGVVRRVVGGDELQRVFRNRAQGGAQIGTKIVRCVGEGSGFAIEAQGAAVVLLAFTAPWFSPVARS